MKSLLFLCTFLVSFQALAQLSPNRNTREFEKFEATESGETAVRVLLKDRTTSSSENSTSATLGAGGTFTGDWIETAGFTNISVTVKSDQDSATDGLKMEFSVDGSTVITDDVYSISANVGEIYTVGVSASYFRVRYVNGATPQGSFQLETILYARTPKPSSHRIADAIDGEKDAELVKSVITGQKPDGSFGNMPVTRDNFPRISLDDVGLGVEDTNLAADKAKFGSAVATSRISLLRADFSLSINENDVATSVSGGGSATQGSGLLTISSGTAATASAKINTNRTIRFAPARETYAAFDASFTLPTSANSNQRAGAFDVNNGYFLGYQGTTFGITSRKSTTDTFVPKASWNGDPLDGSMTSRFTRNGVPEAWDPTKINVYRIRYGSSGGSTVSYQVLAPDGRWVYMHTIRSLNSGITSVTNTNTLPITMEVVKSSADATNLQIRSSSWDGGTTEDSTNLSVEQVKGRKYVTQTLASQTTDQTVHTVSPGRTFKMTSAIISVSNTSVSQIGSLNITDGGAGGTIRIPLSTTDATNQSRANITISHSFLVPLRFSTDVFADITSGTVTYSVVIVGFEE